MFEKSMKYFFRVFIITGLLLAGFLLILFFIDGDKNFHEIIIGFVTGLVIFFVGFLLIIWSLKKPMKIFMQVVLGGIIVKFLLIAAMIFLLIRYSNLDIIYFISSLVAFYLICQFFEFRFINANLRKIADDRNNTV